MDAFFVVERIDGSGSRKATGFTERCFRREK